MSIDTACAAGVTTKETTMSIRNDETLAGRWRLDPQRSTVEFRVGHFWGLLTVRGHFEVYDGRVDLSADPAIELTIDAASVQTGNRKRDEHLRSADFFDVASQPRVQFTSDSAVLQGETLRVHGHLLARDRSIPLQLDARIHRAGGELKIEATTRARHHELGLTWSPLRMIRPDSELRVAGYLVPAAEASAYSFLARAASAP
jgi:polyisoprenoid-binding protein YceI